MKLYQRVLLKEQIKALVGIFCAIFFMFVLLDYAIHAKEMMRSNSHVIEYYLSQASKYLIYLLPLSLLIATIKVLTSMSASRELLALQAGGISLKKIAAPLIITGLGCTLLIGHNFQYWLPKALANIESFEHLRASRKNKEVNLYTVPLEDGTKLYYAHRSLETMTLSDVIWVQSTNEVWRMKELRLRPTGHEGRFVNHLMRDGFGRMQLIDSHEAIALPQLHLETLADTRFFTPIKARPLFELYRSLNTDNAYLRQHEHAIVTQVIYKTLSPLLALLAICAALRPAMRYRRFANPFPIYALASLGFIAVCALLNAAVIVGEAGALSPFFAIGLPLVMLTVTYGGRTLWL